MEGTSLLGLYAQIQGTPIDNFEDPMAIAREIGRDSGRTELVTPSNWSPGNYPQRRDGGVDDEVRRVRGRASIELSRFTKVMFADPFGGSIGDGSRARDNLEKIRSMLRIDDPLSAPGLAEDSSRLINDWERSDTDWVWVLEGFVGLADVCATTMRLFNPSLQRYLALLNAMDMVQKGAAREQQAWEKWRQRNERRSEWLSRQSFDALDRFERRSGFLPPEAIRNLHDLAVRTWRLIAASTHVLGDWDSSPPEEDARLVPTTFGWSEQRWRDQ